MRILLAGGAGAIGRQLVPRLVAAGHEVHATTRKQSRQDLIGAMGGSPVLLDILDRDAVLSAVATLKPDVIINQLTDLAGGFGPGNSFIRVHGTRNLVDAAKANGIERMVSQSIAWVVEPGDGPATEEVPIAGGLAESDTNFGVRSLETTTAELPFGIVLRYGFFYGPGTFYAQDGQNGIAARSGTLVASRAIANFVHVIDAARATVAALDWPAGVVNILDDEPAPGTDWVPVFAAALGGPVPHDRPGVGGGRAISNAKAKSLGFELQFPTWRVGFWSL